MEFKEDSVLREEKDHLWQTLFPDWWRLGLKNDWFDSKETVLSLIRSDVIEDRIKPWWKFVQKSRMRVRWAIADKLFRSWM